MRPRLPLCWLVGACVLLGALLSTSRPWGRNAPYLDLAHAAIRSDDEAAARFERWAQGHDRPADKHKAAMYGMAMLIANQGRELPEGWLTRWESAEGSLAAGTLRGDMMLHALTGALGPDDLAQVLDILPSAAAADWLISAAERRSEEAEVFAQVVEGREPAPDLSPPARVQLATLYGRLALHSYQSNDTEEAGVLADRSLRLDPQNEMGMSVEGLVLGRRDQSQAGIALLDRVTRLHPDSLFGWSCLAQLRLSVGDYQGAERASRIAVGLGSSDEIWARHLLIQALLAQDRCAEALPHAPSAVLQRPNDGHSLLYLGHTYWCMDEKQRASSVYQQLITLRPDFASRVDERIISDE